MRILLLSPNQIGRYNWGHQLFRNEIGKHHNVLYWGSGFKGYDPTIRVPKIVKSRGPFDLILTYGLRYTFPFEGIGEITDIPKAHISVDYFPDATGGTYERNKILFDRDKYDIYFGVVGYIVRNLILNGVTSKAFLLPFSVDSNIYKKDPNVQKTVDVLASYTVRDETYPNRRKVLEVLTRSNFKCMFERVVHNNYVAAINRSKIVVTSNNKFSSLSLKYTEVLSCGTLLLADRPEDFRELGYVDTKHLVLYNSLEDLVNKVQYFLMDEKTRERIALQGMEFVRKRHTNAVRVKQMTDILQKELGIK
jgi:spore maturation protein CgeB